MDSSTSYFPEIGAPARFYTRRRCPIACARWHSGARCPPPSWRFISGGAGNDYLNENLGDGTVNGGPGNDRIIGSVGIDTDRGGPGNDFISGGIGFDTLVGEGGDDVLEPQKGHDVVDGGPGSDTVSYKHEPAGVVVSLAKHSSLVSAGRDSLISIENVTGPASPTS